MNEEEKNRKTQRVAQDKVEKQRWEGGKSPGLVE
jgi:hypothetical protein